MPGESNSDQESLLWKQLMGFIEEGSVVPIVGSELLEIPVGDGPPKNFYTLVAEDLAKALHLDAPRASGWRALNEVACDFLAKGRGQTEDLYPVVKSVVARREETDPLPEALSKLAAIPFRLFVTTTFDRLLVRAIEGRDPMLVGRVRHVEYCPTRLNDLQGVRDGEGPPVVFQLFGKASTSPEYAVTDEDVLEFMCALQSESRRPQELFGLLQRKNLLIVGCGFPDWLARFFVRLGIKDRFIAARGKTDMLADSAAANPEFVAFLDHFGQRTKRFSMPPLEFIARLSEALPPNLVVQPAPPASAVRDPNRDILPGAVFLSYAREDLEVVERISEALNRSGIDCWFDRTQLRAGDDWQYKIARNIDACSLFVAIVSKATLTDEDRFFRVEWRKALERKLGFPDRVKFLVPVRIDKTQPKDSNVLDGFRALHWQDLTGGEVTPEFVKYVTSLFREAQQRDRRS